MTGTPHQKVVTINDSFTPPSFQAGTIAVPVITPFGKTNTPTGVTSFQRFKEEFGDINPHHSSAYAVFRVLEKYRGRVSVVRLARHDINGDPVTATETATIGDAVDGIDFQAKVLGNYTLTLTVADDDPHFKISAYIQGNQNASEQTVLLPKTATVEELAVANDAFDYLQILQVNGNGAFGNASLSVTDDVSQYTINDYVQALHAFDTTPNLLAIGALGAPVDFARYGLDLGQFYSELLSYVETRGDVRAITAPPLGLRPSEAVDFRNGVGFGHSAFDNHLGVMAYGDFNVRNPLSATGQPMMISGDAELAGIWSRKDIQFPDKKNVSLWGTSRGRIASDVLAIRYDTGTPSRKADADMLSDNGLQYFQTQFVDTGNTSQRVIVLWDASTLTIAQKDTLFIDTNVVDIALYIERKLKTINKQWLSEPGVPDSWNQLLRQVERAMEMLKNSNVIHDFVLNPSRLQLEDLSEPEALNTNESVSRGEFKYEVGYAPTRNMKFIYTTSLVNTLEKLSEMTSRLEG